jgi:hypothetical protein
MVAFTVHPSATIRLTNFAMWLAQFGQLLTETSIPMSIE